MIPGFIDSHTHLCYYGLSRSGIKLDGVAPIEEAIEQVRQFVSKKPPGEWIQGIGWNQNLWDRWPKRQDLDEVAPDNPVVLTHRTLRGARSTATPLPAN